MGDAFPISGSIDPTSFPYLLADLHQHAATGSLKVDGPSYQKALYFRSGRILFGSSNDPRDQLGAILIESGRLTPEQLEAASAKVGPGNPLAKVLADGGLVSQRDLSDAAKAKVERILSDLLATTAGAFEFEDDVLPKGAIDLKLVTPRLFAAAVRRISHPGFVQRHLGSSDAVLKLAREKAEALAEALPDMRGLTDLLDGTRALRHAATLARLDDFEAGKLACALLFLGLAERIGAAPPAFEVIDGDLDVDLAQTARLALDVGVTPSAGQAARPAERPAGAGLEPDDTPFFLPSQPGAPLSLDAPPRFEIDAASLTDAPEPEPPPEPTVILAPPAEAPTLIVPAPSGAAAAAPRASQPPRAPEAPAAPGAPPMRPEPPQPPPATARPAPGWAARGELPLVPPPSRSPRAVQPRPRRHEDAEPVLEAPTLSARPSKEDLEALDSLLHSRSLETPLAGSTSPNRPRKVPGWDPSFGRGAPARGRRVDARRGGSRAALVAGVLVALAAAGTAGWYLLLRSPQPPVVPGGTGVVVPRPLATPTPAAASGSAAPGATAASATTAPAPPGPTTVQVAPPGVTRPGAGDAAPTGAPAPAAGAPASQPASSARAAVPPPATTGDARALMRRGDLAAAGRGFASTLKSAPRDSHSIQLLVACAPETVTKAVAGAGAPELFIVPVSYRGRDCYRICWGLFDGRARAESALRSLPSYFRAGGATPRVVPAAELLP